MRRVISDEGPGRIIDVQRKNGAAEVYSGGFTTLYDPLADRTGAGYQNMQLSYTPPVDVWWDVTGVIGIVQKMDAAYHYAYGRLALAPTDVDGVQYATISLRSTQRSSSLRLG